MPEVAPAAGIEVWLQAVRSSFADRAPDLLPLFDTYAGEARFGRTYIAADIDRLSRGAHILEVGAGALLLSCQLVREGFQVTALEPMGEGFSHFGRMRNLIEQEAREQGCLPTVLDLPAEAMDSQDVHDYAFSVNVMEHVADPELVLARVAASLRPGSCYRFTCPNYLFPYEPHFDIPTFVSKSLTARLLGRRILASTRLSDPAGTWSSLNWITVPQVRRAARRIGGARVRFDRRLLVKTIERVVSDAAFASRRSGSVRLLLDALVRLRAHRLLAMVPVAFQPSMDCTLLRVPAPGVR